MIGFNLNYFPRFYSEISATSKSSVSSGMKSSENVTDVASLQEKWISSNYNNLRNVANIDDFGRGRGECNHLRSKGDYPGSCPCLLGSHSASIIPNTCYSYTEARPRTKETCLH
jgi:hypothetical protein